MGTRHLTAVCKNGEYPIAQYGQWDGYPSGQGMTILSYLQWPDSLAKLEAALPRCRWITPDEIKEADANLKRRGVDVGALYPLLTRDAGGDIIQLVAESAPGDIVLRSELEFAADSLFCEFAYVVDLDKRTFEVFKGFNTEPLGPEERFAFLAEKVDRERKSDVYEPVKFWASWPLDSLPADLSYLEPEPEEEDEEA